MTPTYPQRKIARVLFDEGHNEAWSIDPAVAARIQPSHPADSSYARAAQLLAARDFTVTRNLLPLTPDVLREADVLVIAHPSDAKWEFTPGSGAPFFGPHEIAAIRDFVHAGGGLVVLGETEQDKYGNNVNTLLAEFDLRIEHITLTDHAHCDRDVPSWVMADLHAPESGPRDALDLSTASGRPAFCAAARSRERQTRFVARASSSASLPGAGLLTAQACGAGRVVVSADSDLFGDDDLGRFDHQTLWLNLHYFAAGAAFARAAAAAPAPLPADWQALKTRSQRAARAAARGWRAGRGRGPVRGCGACRGHADARRARSRRVLRISRSICAAVRRRSAHWARQVSASLILRAH